MKDTGLKDIGLMTVENNCLYIHAFKDAELVHVMTLTPKLLSADQIVELVGHVKRLLDLDLQLLTPS